MRGIVTILLFLAPTLVSAAPGNVCMTVYDDTLPKLGADCKPIEAPRSYRCTAENPDCRVYIVVPQSGPSCNRPTKTLCASPDRFRQ